MRRFDLVGGWFVRLGRWWYGLVSEFPFVTRVPVIAGGTDVTDEFVASEAFIGYGGQFKVGQGGSPETFTSVPMIDSITIVDGSTGVVDVTHLRSPARHREKRGTIRDSGPIMVKGTYDPQHGAHKAAGGDGFNATHSLLSLWKNVTENNFEIVLPDDAGTVGSPAVDIALPLRGTITKYHVTEMTLDQPVKFEMEVTPLRDYFTN